MKNQNKPVTCKQVGGGRQTDGPKCFFSSGPKRFEYVCIDDARGAKHDTREGVDPAARYSDGPTSTRIHFSRRSHDAVGIGLLVGFNVYRDNKSGTPLQ